MEARRIQLVGKRSYAVSLPKQWVLDNKLKQKDNIFIEKTSNGALMIKPSNEGRSEQSKIVVSLSDIDNIEEFMVFCYIKNVDNLTLLTSKTNHEDITTVRSVLKCLEGFEVTYEDEKRLEISFLFSEFNITLPKLVSRMTHLIRLMYDGLKSKDFVTVNETELVVDRLYHLSKRIIIASFYDRSLREKNGIYSEEDLFFYQSIVKKLENVGDSLFLLSSKELSSSELSSISGMLSIIENLLRGKIKSSKVKENLSKIKINSRKPDVKLSLLRLHDLVIDVFENYCSIQFNKRFF